jgi:hypothetical protein
VQRYCILHILHILHIAVITIIVRINWCYALGDIFHLLSRQFNSVFQKLSISNVILEKIAHCAGSAHEGPLKIRFQCIWPISLCKASYVHGGFSDPLSAILGNFEGLREIFQWFNWTREVVGIFFLNVVRIHIQLRMTDFFAHDSLFFRGLFSQLFEIYKLNSKCAHLYWPS